MKSSLKLFALALLVAGCATSTLQAPADYPQLSVKADEPNTLFFAKPKLQLGHYRKVHVAPVLVQITDDRGTREVSDAEARQVAAYAEQRLKKVLGATMMLVDQPGPGVLSVRFRITGLEPTSKAQIAMMVPPFAMINMLSPKGTFLGSITLAGALHEGDDSQPSVAFVATRSRPGIDASVAFTRWGVVEKVIDHAAERLADELARQRGS